MLNTSALLWEPMFCNMTNELCGYGETHIACNKENWVVRCLKEKFQVYALTLLQKTTITSKLNQIRSSIAEGKFETFEPAAKMSTTGWEDELGYMAELQCNCCEFTYDACFNLPDYPSVAKLVYSSWFFKQRYNEDNLSDFVTEAIDAWFATRKYSTSSFIDKHSRAGYRHESFATLVKDENNRYGCAVLYYQINQVHKYVLFCNFATRCLNYQPIYITGEAGSGCDTGTNPDYPFLCSEDEIYKFMYMDNYYT